ncbi:dephospho-CoA kinase, partial [Candidatus Bipolaricaulota bacterium]|nr:dephospho-CoA kinase [Candidatus Bipolaricaulota bacterium]
TGGIASGKSEVLRVAEAFPEVKTVQADELAKEIYDPKNPCYREVIDIFGSQVLREDGTVDLKKVSEIVFSDPNQLEKLEKISHPYVKGRIEGIVECFEKESVELILVEIPLLFQSPSVRLDIFDAVILVEASEEEQLRRLEKRDSISSEEAMKRMELQSLPEDARKKSNHVISSDGTIDETKRQARQLIKEELLS